VEIRLGTCGWSFPDWKGTFYPPGTKDELAYYASRFDAVEVDNTYYRIPSVKTVEEWRQRTPAGFQFCPKLPGKITHEKVLEGTDELVAVFTDHISGLEDRLGPILIQLAPSFECDRLPKLEAFLSGLPTGLRYAVEFRHRSWADKPEARQLLGSLKIGLVVTHHPRYVRLREVTADFVYLRLMGLQDAFPKWGHIQGPQDQVLGETAEFLQSLPPQVARAFVFLSNHLEGHAPATLERLRALLEAPPQARAA